MTDRQTQRKIDRQLQNESRWLQKVLFALGKARQAREALADLPGQKPDPLIVLDDGTSVKLDALEEVIRVRVAEVMEQLGQGPHRLPG